MVGSFLRKEIAALRREARQPKHRFLISIRQVARRDPTRGTEDQYAAFVIDMETRLAVYETPPQADEADARVLAGLWIEREESGK